MNLIYTKVLGKKCPFLPITFLIVNVWIYRTHKNNNYARNVYKENQKNYNIVFLTLAFFNLFEASLIYLKQQLLLNEQRYKSIICYKNVLLFF